MTEPLLAYGSVPKNLPLKVMGGLLQECCAPVKGGLICLPSRCVLPEVLPEVKLREGGYGLACLPHE